MRIGSLCSGYGGLEMAAASVFPDAELAWYAENDPSASTIMAEHHPGVVNYGDITAVDWKQLPSVDILTAGFPCQNISNAGRRDGIHGDRSSVWFHVAEAVRVLRPRLVFLENVAAILGRGGTTVVGSLAEAGYDCRWTTLRASDVGAAHRRDRWFCVAVPHPEGVGSAGCDSPPEFARLLLSARGGGEAAADTESLGRPARGTESAGRERQLLPARRGGASAEDADVRLGIEWVGAGSGEAEEGGHGPTLDDEACFLLPYADSVGRDGRPGDVAEEDGRREPADDGHSPSGWWGEYAAAVHRWEHVTGMPAPQPTEEGQRGGRRLHAPFAEWLMGLPPGHVTGRGLKRADELKAIGNGVVPQQAATALRMLLGVD